MSTASEVYQEKHTAVLQLLGELGDLLVVHHRQQLQEPLDWGYVGDLAHVEERLKEVVGFLRPVDGSDDDSVE